MGVDFHLNRRIPKPQSRGLWYRARVGDVPVNEGLKMKVYSNKINFYMLAIIFGMAVSGQAFAQETLELLPTGKSWLQASGGWGDGRSDYFRAEEDFGVSEIGYWGGVPSGEYTVEIMEGVGETSLAGSVLASVTINWPGSSPGYIPFPIEFNFAAGNEYIVNFRRADNQVIGTITWHYVSFGNGAEESDIGILTLLDGREGYDANNYSNSVIPRFSFTIGDFTSIAPEPVPVNTPAFLLLMVLLLGFTALRYRRVQ
jgi:hypothetical protein